MKAKHLGFFLVGVSVALFIVTVSFTQTLLEANKILHNSCTLPQSICPYTSFPLQSAAAFLIDITIFASGVFLISNYKKDERISAEGRKTFETSLKSLSGDEKKLYEMIMNEGAIFQSELVEKSGFPKARVTRILDKMEGRGLVERRRRGLTNMVVPKKLSQA